MHAGGLEVRDANPKDSSITPSDNGTKNASSSRDNVDNRKTQKDNEAVRCEPPARWISMPMTTWSRYNKSEKIKRHHNNLLTI